MRITIPASFLLLLLAAACSGTGPGGSAEADIPFAAGAGPTGSEPAPDAATETAWKQQGAALIVPFKLELQAALKGALAGGGSTAIGACMLEAPAIAQRLGGDGVRVGRTSHKLRNPANSPPPWAETLLAEYAAAGDRREAAVRALSDGRVGYVEPITVQRLCLSCHGKKIAEPVATRLSEIYPEDQATGFESGDFRGLFWAEFPPSTTP